MYLIAKYWSFCTSAVVGQHPILQIGDDGVSLSLGGVQAEHLLARSLDARLHHMLNKDLSSELVLNS